MINSMRFSIFTHAEHKIEKGKLYSYRPYVGEMNMWISNFDEVHVIAPLSENKLEVIDENYRHKNIDLICIPFLHFKTRKCFFQSIINSFKVILTLFGEMRKADHIHIRCPGNIGLLAALVQIFFPSKPKTVKYAGNWDRNSKQPLSYRFQKWLLANTFLSHNIKVLVYGKWENQSDNIISFFTATYSKDEKMKIRKEFHPPYKFVFVGSLVDGKRPLLAIKVMRKLIDMGYEVELDLYGDGPCREAILKSISTLGLEDKITFHGNQSAELLKNAYKSAHFSILPSKSEGWPKAISEAMFFGCIPVATSISCVPWMLNQEKRGILIEPSVKSAVKKISTFLNNQKELDSLSLRAREWSQQYTTERFKVEIQKLL